MQQESVSIVIVKHTLQRFKLSQVYGFDPPKPKNPTLSLIQNKIRKSLIQKLQLAQINWKYEASNFVLQNHVMVSFSGQLIMIVIQKFQFSDNLVRKFD